MHIKFSLPLPKIASVVSPALLPHCQTSPVLFLAEVNDHDYAELIAKGGRIELWSDVDSDGAPNGQWGGRRFIDSTQTDEGESLGSDTTLKKDQHKSVHIFYLPVALPPLKGNGKRQFSFTYRIVHSSGHIVWLGKFNQNGHLVLEAPANGVLNGLKLTGNWRNDDSLGAYVRECEGDVDEVELGVIQHPAEFRICALNSDKVLDDAQNASVIFLIPQTLGETPVIHPTYVLSASPNMHLSVSLDGFKVSASGVGNVHLQVKDYLADSTEFIQQVISRCKLDKWNVIGDDMKQAVALAPTVDPVLPIRSSVIPFWPSKFSSQPVKLDASAFSKSFAEHEVKHFVILPSSKKWMRVLPVQSTEASSALCNIHLISNEFSVAPVHSLKPPSGSSNRTEWGVVILSDYSKVIGPQSPWTAAANPLPTPPGSPAISRTSDMHLSVETMLRGAGRMTLELQGLPSLSEHEVKYGEGAKLAQVHEESEYDLGERMRSLAHYLDASHSADVDDRSEGHLAPKSNNAANAKYRAYIRYGLSVVWSIQYVFATLFTILSALLGAAPLSDWGTSLSIDKPKASVNIAGERSDSDVVQVVESGPGDSATVSTPHDQYSSEEVDSLGQPHGAAINTSLYRRTALEGTNCGSVHPIAPISVPEDPSFYANIQQRALCSRDDDLVSTAPLVELVLFPLADLLGAPQNHPYGPSASPDFNTSFDNAMRAAVSFFDENGPSTCVIDRLQSFWCTDGAHAAEGGGDGQPGHPISFTSYLLQYQLFAGEKNRDIVIRVSAPDVHVKQGSLQSSNTYATRANSVL